MYYYKRNHNPFWQDMPRFQREMSRFFDEFGPARNMYSSSFPLMNVYTDKEGAAVMAEVPGVSQENIEINVAGETLSISGEVGQAENEQTAYHRQERAYGKFSRSIELPFPVETDHVEARLEKGILTIHLPRAEEDKPRQIQVKS
jgi:HSP20 family protein